MPHERLLWIWDCAGPWYCVSVPLSTASKRSALLVREFHVGRFSDLSLLAPDGIAFIDGSDGERWLETQHEQGTLDIPIDNAYPVLDVIVGIVPKSPLGKLPALEFYRNGKREARVRALKIRTSGELVYSLRRIYHRVNAWEQTRVRLIFPSECKVRDVRVRSICQIARPVDGLFVPGVNTVQFSADDEGTDPLRICARLSYRKGHVLPSLEDLIPTSPEDGECLGTAPETIAWRGGELDEEQHIRWRIQVAHDADMAFILTSNFDRLSEEPAIYFDEDDQSFFEPGQTYYWRIGLARPDGAHIGRWSRTFSFGLANAATGPD